MEFDLSCMSFQIVSHYVPLNCCTNRSILRIASKVEENSLFHSLFLWLHVSLSLCFSLSYTHFHLIYVIFPFIRPIFSCLESFSLVLSPVYGLSLKVNSGAVGRCHDNSIYFHHLRLVWLRTWREKITMHRCQET